MGRPESKRYESLKLIATGGGRCADSREVRMVCMYRGTSVKPRGPRLTGGAVLRPDPRNEDAKP